jgi:hypothetical protein
MKLHLLTCCLAQTYGAQGENLKYIMHGVIIPAEFVDDAEWCMYQLPCTGEAYTVWTISWFTICSKVSLLTHLVGPGLSHTIQWRMGIEHFLHGQVIKIVKVSY